MTDTGSDEDV